MKKLLLSLVFGVFAFADVLKVSDFQTDIYSKAGQNLTKKIIMNLEVVGRDVEENEAYVLDALNVVMKYAAKKHSLDIDDVLILNIKVINNLELSEIIKAIKSQNLCSDPSVNEDVMTKPEKKKKGNEIIVAPDPNDVVQKPIDLNNVQEFGKILPVINCSQIQNLFRF